MGHNKDIDLLHELTKKPYRICRKQLKTYKWDLFDTWVRWVMRDNCGVSTSEGHYETNNRD